MLLFCQRIPLHEKWSFPLRIASVNVTKSAVIKNQIRWVNNTLMLEKTYWFKHVLVVSSSCFEICEWYPFKRISENMQQTHCLLAFNLHLIICIQKDKIKMYMMHINMHCGDWVPEACPESRQASKTKLFVEIVNDWKPFTILAKSFILDRGSEHAFESLYIFEKYSLNYSFSWKIIHAVVSANRNYLHETIKFYV